MRNIIFDFGNVLVRWEPERVYLPYFDNDEAKYWYFWRHVCGRQWRDRIDAGEDEQECIRELQSQYPEYAGFRYTFHNIKSHISESKRITWIV